MSDNISVVMASYNGEKYISQQLNSIYAQTIPPFEVIVYDDCSTDNTVSILQDYAQNFGLKYFVNKQNKGLVQNFFNAIKASQGDYIALADQDDIWYDDKLQVEYLAMKNIEQDNKACLIFTNLNVVNQNLESLHTTYWKLRGFNIIKERLQTVLFRNCITGCTIFMNKNLKHFLKDVPESAIYHDHWIALLAYSMVDFDYIIDPTLDYRQHSGNVTQSFKPPVYKRKYLRNMFDITSNSQFLMKEFNQAKDFLKYYRKSLSPEKILVFEHFISLEKYPYIVRKIASKIVCR